MEGKELLNPEGSKTVEPTIQKNEVEKRESQDSKDKTSEQDNSKVNWVIRRTGSTDAQSNAQRSSSPTSSQVAAANSLQSLQQQEIIPPPQWKFPSMAPQPSFLPMTTPFPQQNAQNAMHMMRTSPSPMHSLQISSSASPYLSYPPPTSPIPMGLYQNAHMGTPYFLTSPPPPPLPSSQMPVHPNVAMLSPSSPLHALLSAVVDRSDMEHMRRMPMGGMESNYMFTPPSPMYVSPHPYIPSYGYPSSPFPPAARPDNQQQQQQQTQHQQKNSAAPSSAPQMHTESISRKEKRHSKPSSRDQPREGEEIHYVLEENRMRSSSLSKGSRFRLLEEPDEMQRKSYKKENRCLHPNPLVICKRDAKGDTQKLADGFVTVKLVDENGADLPTNKSACLESIDGGLTHPLDEDSSTVFSLKILQTSQGQLFRLLFTVSYRGKGQPNVEEKIYSEPFGVYSNKYDRDSRRKRLKTFVYYRAGMPAPGQTSPTHV
eukprot:TRINITY_DN752_c0_g1_i1.p1 TRINITY_DN752_c0_g1~~TRINITY_DN752_c0_g1_i1.p1  ORF type:complete len:487 (-),score=193.92 TRINITY_DN752_c0_g1_i1:196-1656(-)